MQEVFIWLYNSIQQEMINEVLEEVSQNSQMIAGLVSVRPANRKSQWKTCTQKQQEEITDVM